MEKIRRSKIGVLYVHSGGWYRGCVKGVVVHFGVSGSMVIADGIPAEMGDYACMDYGGGKYGGPVRLGKEVNLSGWRKVLWSGERLDGGHGRKVLVRVEGCDGGKFRVVVDVAGFPVISDAKPGTKLKDVAEKGSEPGRWLSEYPEPVVKEVLSRVERIRRELNIRGGEKLPEDWGDTIDKLNKRKDKKRSEGSEFIARAHYDFDFLNWIYDRLVNVHGENKSYDYMHRLKKVIEDTRLRELKERENVDSNRPLTSEEQAEIDELEKQNEKNWDKLKEMIAEEAAKRERGPWPSPKGRELWIGAFLAGLEEGDLVTAADLADEVYRQYGEKHDA